MVFPYNAIYLNLKSLFLLSPLDLFRIRYSLGTTSSGKWFLQLYFVGAHRLPCKWYLLGLSSVQPAQMFTIALLAMETWISEGSIKKACCVLIPPSEWIFVRILAMDREQKQWHPQLLLPADLCQHKDKNVVAF